jgi:hypothetical protein
MKVREYGGRITTTKHHTTTNADSTHVMVHRGGPPWLAAMPSAIWRSRCCTMRLTAGVKVLTLPMMRTLVAITFGATPPSTRPKVITADSVGDVLREIYGLFVN